MPQAESRRKEYSGDLEGCFSEEVTFKLRPGWPVGGEGAGAEWGEAGRQAKAARPA